MKISELFDNIGIKLICLLLAIVMWVYATGDSQTTKQGEQWRMTLHDIPIQLVGLPQGQWTTKPEKISIEVEFPAAEITMSGFQAVINVVTEDIIKRRVILTARNVKLPEGMGFVKAEPKEIELVEVE